MINDLHSTLPGEPAPHPHCLTVPRVLDELPVEPELLPPRHPDGAPRHQPDPGLVSAGRSAADREALLSQRN